MELEEKIRVASGAGISKLHSEAELRLSEDGKQLVSLAVPYVLRNATLCEAIGVAYGSQDQFRHVVRNAAPCEALSVAYSVKPSDEDVARAFAYAAQRQLREEQG